MLHNSYAPSYIYVYLYICIFYCIQCMETCFSIDILMCIEQSRYIYHIYTKIYMNKENKSMIIIIIIMTTNDKNNRPNIIIRSSISLRHLINVCIYICVCVFVQYMNVRAWVCICLSNINFQFECYLCWTTHLHISQCSPNKLNNLPPIWWASLIIMLCIWWICIYAFNYILITYSHYVIQKWMEQLLCDKLTQHL